MTFTDARRSAQMTRKQVADYLQLTPRTISRYEKTGKAPKAVMQCLLMLSGWCPTFSRRNDFEGWSFGQGCIWSPEGDRFTSGDVRAGRMALIEMNRIYRLEDRLRIEAKKKKVINTMPDNLIHFPTRKQNQNLIA